MTSTSILATAVGPHLFWMTSRAAGIAALVLSSLSVCIGLLMGGGIVKRPPPGLRVTPQPLARATLGPPPVHGLSLKGHSYLHPSLADVAIPFVSCYMTLWTSMGIVAFWMLAMLGLSYYARARIGVQRWRVLHRFTALAWILGIAHSLGEGTDAGQAWFLAMTRIVVVPALVLLVIRHLGSARASAGPPVTAGERRAARKLSAAAIPQPDWSDHGLA